jgi:hypothetical protein
MSPPTISCPSCANELVFEGQEPGAEVVCPMCQTSFPLPATGEPMLDPAERHNPHLGSKEVALACLARWKDDMPEVESAYQPSGRMPAHAGIAMVLGAGIGVLAGTLAALVIGAVTMGVLRGVKWALQGMGKVGGKGPTMIFLVGCAALLAGYAALYVVVGVVTARCTTYVGQRVGKNRSAAAASSISIVAVGVCLMVLYLIRQEFFPWCDPGDFLRHLNWGWTDWLARGLEIAGASLAVALAASQASKMVQAKKFCESCELFMEESALPEVGLGGLRILTTAVQAGEMEAVSCLFDEPPAGIEGKAVLFHCPLCSEGFLEVHAHFHASWPKDEKSNESKEESWMTASEMLSEKEVELLRPFAGKA